MAQTRYRLYAAAGFGSIITAYMPYGSSTYHGWANQLTRRFSNGLEFVAAYTWSHAIDNSTADVHSTNSTPRRPEDSQNVNLDRSSSALDHRNRFTFAAVYDVPYFKRSSNWFMKNLVGNWELAPIYTYQTGTLWTVQSGEDANMNGDTAPDRAIVNPTGNPNIGSGYKNLNKQCRGHGSLPGSQPQRWLCNRARRDYLHGRTQHCQISADRRRRSHCRETLLIQGAQWLRILHSRRESVQSPSICRG